MEGHYRLGAIPLISNRARRLYTSCAAFYVLVVHFAQTRLLRLPSQLACHPISILVRGSAVDCHVAVRQAPGALYHFKLVQHLDLSVACGAHHHSRWVKSMVAIRSPVWSSKLPILPCDPGRLEREELELGSHARSVCSILQHVRTIWQHHLDEHLP